MSKPQRAPVAELVWNQLNERSENSGPLAVNGSRATVDWFSPTEQARRVALTAREFLGIQTDVGSDGRIAVVTAGPPGAGKSTLLDREGLLNQGFRNIDSDLIKDLLLRRSLDDGHLEDLLDTKLADGRPTMPRELSGLVHLESVRVAQVVTEIALDRGENVVLQGTLAWDQQPRILLDAISAHGYRELTIVDVEQSLDQVLERSKDRWWLDRIGDRDGLGGRFVAGSSIAKCFNAAGTTYCAENARLLFEISELYTRLILSDRDRRVVEYKNDDFGTAVPSLFG